VTLRAVFDDGRDRTDGVVHSTWSSGIVVRTAARPKLGSSIALVVLSGGFDGARLHAKVTGHDRDGLVLELPGLDTLRFMRLVSLVDGVPLTADLPPGAPPPAPPHDAPKLILSGEDDLEGDPTGTISLTPDMRKARERSGEGAPFARAPRSSAKKPGAPARGFAPAPVTVPGVSREMLELTAKNAALLEENTNLRDELTHAKAMRAAVEDELKDALARLDAIEKVLRTR
jgi:hypothetical protein